MPASTLPQTYPGRVADAVTAGLLLLGSLLAFATDRGTIGVRLHETAPDTLGAPLAACVLVQVLPLLWLRRRPALTTALVGAGFLVAQVLQTRAAAANLALAYAFYVAATTGRRSARWVCTVVASAVLVWALGLVPGATSGTWDGALPALLFLGVPFGIGLVRRRDHRRRPVPTPWSADDGNSPGGTAAAAASGPPTAAAASGPPTAAAASGPPTAAANGGSSAASVPSEEAAVAGTSCPVAGWSTLTGREQQVARMLADGMSNAEIAGTLFISRETVKTHVGRILAKLGVRDRTQVAITLHRGQVPEPHGRATGSRDSVTG